MSFYYIDPFTDFNDSFTNSQKMAGYLVEEIAINILHRLPIKTLLRCTAVCKLWFSLITTPQFIKTHLNKSPFLLLRRCRSDSERYDLISDYNDSFSLHSNLEFPFRSINAFFTIVGFCNGLLCLSDDRVYYTQTIILWNPTLRKSVFLPKPDPIPNAYGTYAQSLGFGFDPVSGDFKVVKIAYLDHITVRRPHIELYELSTHIWRDLSFLRVEHVIYSKSRQAFVNGAAHWLSRHMDSYDSILSFHMCNEIFGEVKLPCILADDDLIGGKDLVVFNDSLALMLSSSVSGRYPRICIWVMKEYGVQESWSKHLSFDFQSIGERLMRPLWVGRNGGVLTLLEDSRLICCHLDGEIEEVTKDVEVGGSDYRPSIHVDSYVESLFLLERGIYSSLVQSG